MTGGAVFDRQVSARCGDVYGHHRCQQRGCGCPCHLPAEEAFAESVRTGKLWLPIDDYCAHAQELLGRPIYLHELAHPRLHAALRAALAGQAYDLPECLPLPDSFERLQVVVVPDRARRGDGS